jgi:DNA-binding NarL/FixJ family response regulator
VLIIDDHPMMREGLASLLAFETDIEIVGQAGDVSEAIATAASLNPDVVLMDIELGAEMDGIEATRRILATQPLLKVIGLSMHTEAAVAKAMREAGAVAYIPKGGQPDDLIAAIRSCCTW